MADPTLDADSATDHTLDGSLVRWALGSAHAATFVVASVLGLHLATDLGAMLDALDTWIGAALYLFLWGISWWIAGGVVRTIDAHPGFDAMNVAALLAMGGYYGALTGIAFATPFVLAFAVPSLLEASIVAAYVMFVGWSLSALVGGGVGIVLGAFDLCVLWAVFGVLPSDAETPTGTGGSDADRAE